MTYFAVIDTETNWCDQVMSVGTVVAQSLTFEVVDAKYHILTPECQVGGMFQRALYLDTPAAPRLCTRQSAMEELLLWLKRLGVRDIFAYNARFDQTHLPELRELVWHDIMALAAYRQHNPKIPPGAPCCSTGRLKRGYGVEPILRLLSGDRTYGETHNALWDALDELRIMKLLDHPLERYGRLESRSVPGAWTEGR